VEEMRQASRQAAHALFHATIAQASGNRLVVAQVPMVRLTAQMRARRLQQFSEHEPVQGSEILEEGEEDHVAIINAIEAGDGRTAEASARRHIHKTIRALKREAY
jgi:DNA-binding GntR family transcriptional regulator